MLVSSINCYRPTLTLSRTNQERVFKLLRVYFESKELQYVIELGNHSIALKDKAAVRYTLLSYLDKFDEEEIEGIKSKGVQDYLQKKYSRTRLVADRANLRELYSFQLRTLSINDAQIKLKELRRRVVTADSTQKASLTEEALFSLLLEALPPLYETVVDSLDSST